MPKRGRSQTLNPAVRRAGSLPRQQQQQQHRNVEAEPRPHAVRGAMPARKPTELFLEATEDPAQAEELERQQDA